MLEEVQAAWGWVAKGAKAKLRGEPLPYEDLREQDRDTIERWAETEGADLENEAQRAKEKLRNVGRTQP